MSDGIISSVLNWLRAGYPEGVPTKDYFPLLALLHNSLTEDEFAAIVEQIEQHNPDPVRVSTIRAAIEQVTTDIPSEDEIRQVAARLAAAGWPLSRRARSMADEATPSPTATVAEVEDGDYVAPAVGDDAVEKESSKAPDEASASAEILAPAEPPARAEAAKHAEAAKPGGAAKPGVITLALEWLRAGYPEGIPPKDYIPILALLRRRLSDDDVREVAHVLIAEAEPFDNEVSRIDAQVLITKVLGDLPSEDDVERVKSKLESSGFTLV